VHVPAGPAAAADDDNLAADRPCYARASSLAAATAAASSSAASTGSALDCKRQRLIEAASAAKNPVVRAHLSALNGLGSAALSHFSLDEEDTVTFKVCTSAVRGTVSVSLFEISSYPRTGGYAYVVEGCDELTQAVESIAEQLSDRASLDNCVRLLCRALGGPPELSELLARLPASGGSGGGASCFECAADSNGTHLAQTKLELMCS
jgi:hypothetical protein